MNEKILIIGDTHAKFNYLKNIIDAQKPDLTIQLGDFGFWPNDPTFKQLSSIKDYNILFIDGNHEDHESLKKFENVDNLKYMKRGSVYQLNDGRKCLFMGGANSIDKDIRTPGFDWFPEETIKDKDIVLDNNLTIDIVFSHTCPESFLYDFKNMPFKIDEKDPSRKYLQIILEYYKPSLWYFGHFHTYQTGKYKSTKWTCLNQIGDNGYWDILK